jgi:vacuolar-type H+-ATPase subunit H
MASPGEFVVKASSAKRLGSPALEYMNQTGNVPGLAEGGDVPEWARKYPNLYGMYGAGKAAGQALVGSVKDIGHMAVDPFMDIYKGEGNYIANLAYAAMSAFPQAKGTMTGISQLIKGPLGKKLVKQGSKYLTRTESIAAKSVGKPAEAVFDAAKQDEAILATLRLNRQYKEIQDATGLTANFNQAQFVDLLGGASNVKRSEMALSEAIDQLGVVAKKVGAKHLNLTEIGAASLENPNAFAEFVTPRILRSKQGVLRLSKEHWRDPRSITESFEASRVGRDMGMGGQFADVDPKEAFRYAMTHDTGHAYTTITEKTAAPASVELRKSITKAFVTDTIKKPVSRYAETSASEAMAETFASAFHTDIRKATQEVLDLRKSLGITRVDDILKTLLGTKRGGTNLGYALGERGLKDPTIFGDMLKVDKQLVGMTKAAKGSDDLTKQVSLGMNRQSLVEGKRFADVVSAAKQGKTIPQNSATKDALAYMEGKGHSLPRLGFAGGGWVDSLKEMWAKFMPAASAEGETVSAPEVLRRVKEREQKIKDAVEGMQGGGWIDTFKDIWTKFMPAAPAEGETVSAPEVLRRVKEREQKIKDAVEGMQGGGWIDTVKDIWTKFMPAAPAEGETVSAPEVLRRVKEREQKQKDIIEEMFDAKQTRSYQDGGWVDSLKGMWSKFMGGESSAEGETVSAPEAIRRLKEREEKIKKAVESKQDGGWVESLKAIAQGKIEDVKGIYENIKGSALRAFTSPEGTIEREALTGELTKKRVEEALGEKINSYSQGTAYVPQTQLAMLHPGEAVIPAEYNTGGFIGAPKFQAGGAVNPLKAVVGVGEEIGEAIVKKIEEATIKAPEIPPLEIGNLDELQSILGEGAVGAERGQGKLDQFVTKVDDELRRFDDELVSTSEKVTVLELDIQRKVDGDIRELKTTVVALDRKVTDIYTQSDRDVDLAAEKSELEAKLIETIDELKTLDLIPMRSDISLIRQELNNAIRAADALNDRVTANINLNGLR